MRGRWRRKQTQDNDPWQLKFISGKAANSSISQTLGIYVLYEIETEEVDIEIVAVSINIELYSSIKVRSKVNRKERGEEEI